MAVVTKTIIYLGQAAEIDTVEAGGRFRGGENTKAVLGKKYSADKSDAQLIEVGFNDVNNNDILEEDTVYDSHGRVAGHHAETLRYDLGDGPVETTLDFTAFARVTIKLNGGGSHKVTAGLLQGDNGALFLEELTGAPRSLDNLDIKWIKINALDHVNTQGDGYLSTDSSVTNTTVCYCEGTLIRTASGDVAVEELAEGDMLITDQGAQVPVKWIGRQTLSSRFGAPERLMPVRFAAGSLGQDLPHTDLTVTADHGMLVDGVICHAGALVNGSTITRVPLAEMGDRFTVYHIETDAHDMIFANGAVAETFIDNTSRAAFDNYAEFLDRFGEPAERIEADYPRAMSARQVPAHIRARLATYRVA